MDDTDKKVTETSDEENLENQAPELNQAQQEDDNIDELNFSDIADIKLPDGFDMDDFLERFNHANFRVPNKPKPKNRGFSWLLSYATTIIFLLLFLHSNVNAAYANNFGSFYQIIKESKDEIIFSKTGTKDSNQITKIKYHTATLEDLRERKQDNLFLPKGLMTGKETYQIKICRISSNKEIIRLENKIFSTNWMNMIVYNYDGYSTISTDKALLFTSPECVFSGARFYVYENGAATAVFTAGNRLYYLRSNYPLNELITFINSMEVMHE